MIHQIKLTAPSKKRTIWTCVLCGIILLCIYVGIFHQYYKVNMINAGTLFWAGALSLTHLKQLWLDTSKMNWTRILFPIAIIIIMGLSVLAIFKLQKVYYGYELTNHGYTVTGKVESVQKYEFFDLYHDHYAVVSYKFNNKNYIQKIDNKEQKLNRGNIIMLRLSTQHPKIIEVVDVNSFIE